MPETTYTITLPADTAGFLGRECPEKGCKRYFKITPGTGLRDSTTLTCPYCGHTAEPSDFYTEDQVEYAKSVVLNKVTGELLGQLKKMERRPRRGAFIDLSIKVRGRAHPIHRYLEADDLEQILDCSACSLRYAIYGAFGYCPDCQDHNSFQILGVNLALAERIIDLAAQQEAEITRNLVENALEDVVAAFDGFGREVCRVVQASQQAQDMKKISFQNIIKARDKVRELFGLDFAAALSDPQWKAIVVSLQKRHVLAHCMGVIDQQYLDVTDESSGLLGRRVHVAHDEVRDLIAHLRVVGAELSKLLARDR